MTVVFQRPGQKVDSFLSRAFPALKRQVDVKRLSNLQDGRCGWSEQRFPSVPALVNNVVLRFADGSRHEVHGKVSGDPSVGRSPSGVVAAEEPELQRVHRTVFSIFEIRSDIEDDLLRREGIVECGSRISGSLSW